MRTIFVFTSSHILYLALLFIPFAVCELLADNADEQRAAMVKQLTTGDYFTRGKMADSMLDGAFRDVDEIVFAVRIPGRDHWYVSFGNYSDMQLRNLAWKEENGVLLCYGEGAALCKLNIRTGELTCLLVDERGGIRDPQVHYDGEKVLFSYRKGGEHPYHLYEINLDGSNLRQITDGPDDDIEPTYTASGDIVFCSSRCHRFVNCWYTRVATLYRCDGDGKNVRMLSSNNDHDNTPWPLPDGRILYMRWEYVDRSQVDYHHLWTMNPDGTQQMVYFGNMNAGEVMLDAKPIPGTDKVVASVCPGHGSPEHFGLVKIISPKQGPDFKPAARQLGKHWVKDPYALDENSIICANNDTIWWMNGKGDIEPMYLLPKELRDKKLAVHEPRPVIKRQREEIPAPRVNLTRETGTVMLDDIYQGRNMAGIERGKIKKLLVLKQVPKPINFSGGMEPLTIGGTFTLAEIVGTIPVAPDGSAFAELPALQSLFFVALDENDLAVKRMHSFLTLQPGENIACIGCHEDRATTPLSVSSRALATLRPPSRPEPIANTPTIFDFPRDIQPILDKHCVSCHDADNYAGKIDLSGDKTFMHTMSFVTLTTSHRLAVDNRNRAVSNFGAYQIGSGASPLMKYLDGSHHDVKLTQHERDYIRLWIDTSATYPGTYAALRSGVANAIIDCVPMVERCGECHTTKETREGKRKPWEGWTFRKGDPFGVNGTTYNLTNPEKSFLLTAPLAKEAGGLQLCSKVVFESKDDPYYKHILQRVTEAKQQLESVKRFDMSGFRPNNEYIREMQRFGFVKKDLKPDETFDFYAAEKEYFDSWYYKP